MAGTDPTEPVLVKTKKKHQECSNREDSVRRFKSVSGGDELLTGCATRPHVPLCQSDGPVSLGRRRARLLLQPVSVSPVLATLCSVAVLSLGDAPVWFQVLLVGADDFTLLGRPLLG